MSESQNEGISRKEKNYHQLQMMRCEGLFCRKCVSYFPTKSEFSQHVDKHIKENNEGKLSYMSYIEKFICSSCGEQFEVKSDLIIHYNTVCLDAAYTCKHCKEYCENAPFLQMHLLFHHNYSEEMLRNEGFMTDIDTNPLVSNFSFIKSFRRKAFKSPTPEDTAGFGTVDNTSLTKASSSNSEAQRNERKHRSIAFNSVDKAHTCTICNESFSRKCVLEIHVQKHFLKRRKKTMSRDISKKSSIMKSSENIRITSWNTPQESKHSDNVEAMGQLPDNQRAILKPCNVVLRSTAWKKFLPKSKFQVVKSSASTRRGMRKKKVPEIFEHKEQHSKNLNAISQPSNGTKFIPAWKKIKLRSRIPHVAVSDDQNVPEKAETKTKLRRRVQNVAASKKQNDSESSMKKLKLGRKIKKVAVSEVKNDTETSNKTNSGNFKNVAAIERQKNTEVSKRKYKQSSKLKNISSSASNDIKNAEKSAVAVQPESSKIKVQKNVPKNEVKQVFICEICKRQFQDSYKLKRHRLIHTGERPYICTKCKKTFARVDHMKRHLKKVCSKTGKSK